MKTNHSQYKHGGRRSALYSKWIGMKTRCLNPNDKFYHLYGGRGISICDEWLHDFTAFRDSMGEPPSSHHQLDRIDVDGPYSPENCKWSTPTEQARNRRSNAVHQYHGRNITLAEAVEISGVGHSTLIWRMRKSGMSLEEAMEKKPKKALKWEEGFA